MSDLPSPLHRLPPVARAVLALALGWAFSLRALHNATLRGAARWLEARGWPNVGEGVFQLGELLRHIAVDPLLFLISFAVPVALLARTLARARVLAGLPDPLDAVRAWTERNRRLTATAITLPALFWVANPLRHLVMGIVEIFRTSSTPMAELSAWTATPSFVGWCIFEVFLVVTAFGVRAGLRRGVSAFLSPTLGPDRAAPVSGERVGFDAVAVTAETRGAVAAMGALGVGMFAAMLVARTGSVVAPAALAAYMVVAVAALEAFRRASRVAIGVDGVFVTGSSRSRFYAYNDLDGVRAPSGTSDLELLRKGRVVLRLQLHGEDAAEREVLFVRITEAVAAARAGATSGVGDLVGSVSEGDLARLADGSRGYRTQGVTREQLWSVIEGPEHDASARTAAARALARTGEDGNDRTRLRVAAARSAEPRLRVALEAIADEEREDDPKAEGEVRLPRCRA